MTADDRGATVPAAHVDAVARLIESGHYIPGDLPEREMLARDDSRRILRSAHPAVLDALAWAVTRTPEGRDKMLAALVETGTLTEEAEPAWGPHGARRRLVTEWTEVEP